MEKIDEHNQQAVIARWRAIVKDSDSLSDEQILVDWYEQLAANSGVSFQTWRMDSNMEEWEYPYAEQGFKNFSAGMVGIL